MTNWKDLRVGDVHDRDISTGQHISYADPCCLDIGFGIHTTCSEDEDLQSACSIYVGYPSQSTMKA